MEEHSYYNSKLTLPPANLEPIHSRSYNSPIKTTTITNRTISRIIHNCT